MSSTLSHFPTEQSESVRKRGEALLEQLIKSEGWSQISGSPGRQHAKELWGWSRDCRHLARSAGRPPAVGVFGESQVGKSYMVSQLSGQADGILLEDPQAVAGQKLSSNKPWAATYASEGGISFLKYLNAENNSESTGLTCRFTRFPVDKPTTDDCFIGRVLSHCDLLMALSTGYMFEVDVDEDPDVFAEVTRPTIEALSTRPREANRQRVEDLLVTWQWLSEVFGSRPYLLGLKKAGYGRLVEEMVAEGNVPSGDGWLQLIGMLWNAGENQWFSRLYQQLSELLQKMDYPDLLEIPTALVCRVEGSQTPLTDVQLLDQIFVETHRETAYARKDNDTQAVAVALTRPEISALVSELALTVVPSRTDQSQVLDYADVLDFPGARAAAPVSQDNVSSDEVGQANAMAAFRRGKLTRLFSSLTEQREITSLCLVAHPENLEAGPVVRTLMDSWLGTTTGAGSAVARPGLFLVLTKCDILVNPRRSTDYAKCKFGQALYRVWQAYSRGSQQQNWMDNWNGRNQSFKDVHFVHNPDFPIDKSDPENIGKTHDLFVENELVQKYVDDPQRKWDSLLNNGGVDLLVDRVAERMKQTDKYGYLKAELDQLQNRLGGLLQKYYRSADDYKQQEQARADAARDVEALKQQYVKYRRNSLSELLDQLMLDEQVVRRVADRLDRKHGTMDEAGLPIAMTFDRFVEEVYKTWRELVSERLDQKRTRQRIAVADEVYESLTRHLPDMPTQPWMVDSLREKLEHYFEMPHPGKARRSLPASATWLWNRMIHELDEPMSIPEHPQTPPKLSSKSSPPWFRTFDHWANRMPDLYAANIACEGAPPPGNDEAGAILKNLSAIA